MCTDTPAFSPSLCKRACSVVEAGYPRTAHTHRYVFPQMNRSVSNRSTDGAARSRNSLTAASCDALSGAFLSACTPVHSTHRWPSKSS